MTYPAIEFEVRGVTAQQTEERAWSVALAYFECPEDQIQIEYAAGTCDEIRSAGHPGVVSREWETTVTARRVPWRTNGRGGES